MPELTAPPREVDTDMRQGRPWWKMCCGGCCLMILLVVIGAGLAWRGMGGGSGPQLVDELPYNFPPGITLYRLDEARSIEYFSGRDKNRTFSTLMSPLRFFGNVMVSSPEAGSASGTPGRIDRFMDVNASRLQQVDTVMVRWVRLRASKDEMYRFYLEQFQRNGYAINSRRDDVTASDTVIAKRDDITVQLQVQDLPDIEGIDTITLIVDYSNQEDTP